MQKIIIDTNVFVSALIQRSYPFYIVDSVFINNKIKLCISNELFEEYFEVLNRFFNVQAPASILVSLVFPE